MISKSVYHICTTPGVIRVNVSVVLQMALYCELPAGVPNIRYFLSIEHARSLLFPPFCFSYASLLLFNLSLTIFV